MDILLDEKLNCISVMTKLNTDAYLKLVENAYENRGGISGQREALKQKTAISIRNRMIGDIKEGTILPPIVIGAVVSREKYEKIKNKEIYLDNIIDKDYIEQISIIDGMQRTTALMKAAAEEEKVKKQDLRIEYWISDNSNSLLYRMLVLNTGQVPWNVRRQIEVIFSGIIQEIRSKVDNIEIYAVGDSSKRSRGGQYQADDLVELFLAFGARTWKIDTKEKLTDEFTRHDFLQSSGEIDLVYLFCDILKCMAQLDTIIDQKYKGEQGKKEENITGKFKAGKDLFGRQPARIGFAAAAGEKILGRPGDARCQEKIAKSKEKFLHAFSGVMSKIESKDREELEEYIDFATLNQMIERRTSKIGDFERELFYEAFKVIIDEGEELSTLGIGWRAF